MRVHANEPNVISPNAAAIQAGPRTGAVGPYGSLFGEGDLAKVLTGLILIFAGAVFVAAVLGSLFGLPLISNNYPILLRYGAGALFVFLVTIPIAYKLGLSGFTRAEHYYQFWSSFESAPVVLALSLCATIIFLVPSSSDMQAHMQLKEQAAVSLPRAFAHSPQPAAAQLLAAAQAEAFKKIGRYTTAVRLPRVPGRDRSVRSLAVTPNGRTWIAQLAGGWLLTQTHGQELMVAHNPTDGS